MLPQALQKRCSGLFTSVYATCTLTWVNRPPNLSRVGCHRLQMRVSTTPRPEVEGCQRTTSLTIVATFGFGLLGCKGFLHCTHAWRVAAFMKNHSNLAVLSRLYSPKLDLCMLRASIRRTSLRGEFWCTLSGCALWSSSEKCRILSLINCAKSKRPRALKVGPLYTKQSNMSAP